VPFFLFAPLLYIIKLTGIDFKQIAIHTVK